MKFSYCIFSGTLTWMWKYYHRKVFSYEAFSCKWKIWTATILTKTPSCTVGCDVYLQNGGGTVRSSEHLLPKITGNYLHADMQITHLQAQLF